MNKTIGVFAHVDAGKTTFSEGLLYHTQTIKTRGRVDHKNAFLDTHAIERARGITIFAEEALMSYGGDSYFLIDTPGHIDFSPEVERSILVMDYAIVIISAAEGIEGHTETVWQLLEKHKIPVFVFINKCDRVGADLEQVMHEIRKNLSVDCCLMSAPYSEDFMGFCAEREDSLLALYLEEKLDPSTGRRGIQDLIRDRKVFPCLYGSALQDEGILSFLEVFHHLTRAEYGSGEVRATVYKITFDEAGTKVTHLKLLSGTMEVRDEVPYVAGGIRLDEKITQIRLYSGGAFTAVKQATAGMLIGVVGLSQSYSGMGIGMEDVMEPLSLRPALKSKVSFDPKLSIKDVLKCFRMLEEENPALDVQWDETLKELHIHVMGTIQLEILKEIMGSRFDMQVSFEKPRILYRETIENTVKGYGHFEPLRHYAEVHLELSQNKRGIGVTFENRCHADDMTLGNQRLIESHIFEKAHRGVLTGSSLTDVHIALLTGRGHNEYTSGGDFREATFRALRQGLEKAENVLLEPYYQFKIKAPVELMGRLISDVQKGHGTFDPPELSGDKVWLSGRIPVATWMDYPLILAALSGGKATLQLLFAGYDVCHNTQQVIEEIGYKRHMDPEYTSSSVFCAKGKGYTVLWDEVEAKIHCGD